MHNQLNITPMILAGGFGTRLRSIVPDRQKTVADVDGKPFILNIFDQLLSAEFKKVILCTGYLSADLKNLLGDRYNKLQLIYSEESSPLGTAGAIRNGVHLIDSDNALVMNGDSYSEIDLNKFIKRHYAENADASIALVKVDDISRYGAVELNSDSLITKFDEKGKNSGAGLINSGIYILPKKTIFNFQPNISLSLEKDIFPDLIKKRVYGYRDTGRFIDIGVPEDYLAAEEFFRIGETR